MANVKLLFFLNFCVQSVQNQALKIRANILQLYATNNHDKDISLVASFYKLSAKMYTAFSEFCF